MNLINEKLKNSKIDKEELRMLIFETEKKYKDYKDFLKLLEEIYPLKESLTFYEKSRTEQISHAYKLSSKLIENNKFRIIRADDENDNEFLFGNLNLVYTGMVGHLMVIPIFNLLGTDEQKNKWLPLLKSGYCIASYSQTELGHGSDVQSLQTEAHFKGDHFLINTPDISSKKYWPGEISHVSNLALVNAKLIIKGENHGIFPFLVETRDLVTHKPKKGVEIKDLGPKLGYYAKENGILTFNNVKIPLNNLINKYVTINEKGEIKKTGDEKVIYSGMMVSRIGLVFFSCKYLAKGLNIALRYSHYRTQFKGTDGKEIPIIKYQLQKNKLYRLLSQVYAMLFSFKNIRKYVLKNQKLITEKNDFSLLQECHIFLSGTKAYFTQTTLDGLMVCLQACGGHGYSKFSGIPTLIENFLPNCILEGENTILYLQVARFLTKSIKNAMKGKKLHGSSKYLMDREKLEEFTLKEEESELNLENLRLLIAKCSYKAIMKAGNVLMENELNDLKKTWDFKAGISLVDASKIHIIGFTYYFFMKAVNNVKNKNLKLAFERLNLLFGLDEIIRNSQIFLEHDIINASIINIMKIKYEKLLDEIDIDSMSLIEGFEFSDTILYSAIGHSNGKPYENLYNWAKDYGQLNKFEVFDDYFKYIRKSSLKMNPNPKL